MTKKSQAEFIKWFGPLLDALRELGDSGKPKEVSNKIAENLRLPDSLLDKTTSKLGLPKFHNQVAWARQYLVWEGLLDSSKHGTWKLTEKGKSTHLTEEQSSEIFTKWVRIHQKGGKEKSDKEGIEKILESSPENEKSATTDLLEVLQSLSASGFEKVCKELLRESGFESVEVTGQSHDGGIDGYGILEVNPFVSFKVLFQCKKIIRTVSRAQVGDFRNAMIGRAEKGIIMTTGTFSNDAIREANRDGAPQIELVDSEKLVEMFQRVELGVKLKTVYEVDLAYFQSLM
jgi:restriction system protein